MLKKKGKYISWAVIKGWRDVKVNSHMHKCTRIHKHALALSFQRLLHLSMWNCICEGIHMQKKPKPTRSPTHTHTHSGMRSGTDCCTVRVCWQPLWLLHLPCAKEWALKATSHVVHHHCEPLNPLAFTGDVKRPMNGNYFNFNILVKHWIKKERNKAGGRVGGQECNVSFSNSWILISASERLLINLSDLLCAIYTRLKQPPPRY